jgi:hypothetical protein
LAAGLDDDEEEDEEDEEDEDLARSPLGLPPPFEPEEVDFESDEPDDSDAEPDDDAALAAVRLSVL